MQRDIAIAMEELLSRLDMNFILSDKVQVIGGWLVF